MRNYLCSLARKGPVEDTCADLLAFYEAVCFEAVDDFLDAGEGNACLDGELLYFLVVEDSLLSERGEVLSYGRS